MHSRKESHMNNDERLAILETTILNINSVLIDIKQDIKRLSDKVDHQSDHLTEKMDKQYSHLNEKMDKQYNHLNEKMDKQYDHLNEKYNSLSEKMEARFDSLQNRLWSNFLWLMGMIIGLAGLIAHTQHWI